MLYLETPRLYFRIFQPEDATDLFRIEGDADVMRFIRTPTADISHSHQRIANELAYAAENEGLGLCACYEKESGTFVGLVKIKHVENTDAIEVGYGFVPEAWGKGYATEVTRASIEHLQTNFTGRPIIAFIHPNHHSSRHVLEKAGMKQVTTVFEGHEDAVVFAFMA